MRLSNTLMMNESLLPTGKKAFTLAEVLITLSILGVVAALTIPSLVNRQSDLAAQVKLKKAIANYENVAAVYMVENEETNLSTLVKDGCDSLGNYFKTVERGTIEGGGCTFTTADGVFWAFSTAGNALVYDSENSPRYAVSMWAKGGEVNGIGNEDGENNSGESVKPTADEVIARVDGLEPLKGYFSPSVFLNSKASDLSKDKDENGSASCGQAAAGITVEGE